MSSFDPDREDTTVYKVVVNHEEQYSIWPASRDNPLGWKDGGKEGPKAECLEYIQTVWTDMRPLSLRKAMEEAERTAAAQPESDDNAASEPDEESLVDRLCRGDHPVEVSLRPDKTSQALKERLDMGYVHVKFTSTRGGTELGLRLNKDQLDLSQVDFGKGTGRVRLDGRLTLDYVKVRCIADIELPSLSGTGRLERVSA
jgi:uncharacterized protein YbdZ (MbtH family)